MAICARRTVRSTPFAIFFALLPNYLGSVQAALTNHPALTAQGQPHRIAVRGKLHCAELDTIGL
jgi:hypothetical protein